LEYGFYFVAQILVLVACAYALVPRGYLPGFFPHAARASKQDNSIDLTMAAICFAVAGVALYGAHYARTHRSWLRPQRWHRKHGRA
jgi:hypothetical protein